MVDSHDSDAWFCTYSGRKLYILNPDYSQFVIEDFAVPLSRIYRFGGHTRVPITVAQHSTRVSYLCPPELAFCGLAHDLPEAVTGDCIGPMKRFLPDFKTIERTWWLACSKAFGLPETIPPEVKNADLVALAEERCLCHPNALRQRWFIDDLGIRPRHPLEEKNVWSSDRALAEFMRRWTELTSKAAA